MIFFAVAVAVWTAYASQYDIFYTYSFWCELLAKLVEVNLKKVTFKPNPSKKTLSVDSLLNDVNSNKFRFQLRSLIILGIMYIFVGVYAFTIVFLFMSPKFYCLNPETNGILFF